MNMMTIPKIGTRFSLHGQDFEVTFFTAGVVRYAATAGGKAYKVPIESFMELCNQNKIVITDGGHNIEISAADVTGMIRKKRYVEAALGCLEYPTSVTALVTLISKVSVEICDAMPPIPRTVARWIKKFRESCGLGLIQKTSRGNQLLRFSPLVEQLLVEGIQNVYLKPERTDSVDVRAYIVGRLLEMGLLTSAEPELTIPSVRTIQRRIKQLDPYVVVRAKRGELVAQRFVRASGRQLQSLFVLSIVQIDTHYLDVLVRDPDTGNVLGRPCLVCICDVNTRMVIGMDISLYPPSSISSLSAFKEMIIDYGIPSRVIPDNGVEIKNSTFSRLCETLSITIERAQIRDPNGKAHIESFFRTLTYGITQKLPGTTFSNINQRGSYDSTKMSVFTLAQVQELIRNWINNVYHVTIHTRTGRAPILAWEDAIKAVPPTRLGKEDVDAMARKPYSRHVHNGRVLINYIEYFSHALSFFNGREVVVLVDELNLNTVYIQNPDDNDSLILAESTNPEYTENLTIYVHEESLKIKKEMSRNDLARLGKYAALHARYLLLDKINKNTKSSKRFLKKIKNGKSIEKNSKPEHLINLSNSIPQSAKSNVVTIFDDEPHLLSKPVKKTNTITYETLEIDN